MSDVLERLRSDNPVDAGSPPGFEEVWMRARERGVPTRGVRRTRGMALVALVTLPVVLVATIAVLTLGRGRAPGGVTGSPRGAVVFHYRVRSVFTAAREDSATSVHEVTVSDVWLSGATVHTITASQFFARSGRPHRETRLRETVTNGRTIESFMNWPGNPRGSLFRGGVRIGGRGCALFFNPVALINLAELCGYAFRDPAAAVRELYMKRDLTLAKRGLRLNGDHVDELTLAYPGWVVAVFVKLRTFIPVEVIGHSRAGSQTVTATITDYRRIPLSASDRSLLQMRPHPGAPVFCTMPSGALAGCGVASGAPKNRW